MHFEISSRSNSKGTNEIECEEGRKRSTRLIRVKGYLPTVANESSNPIPAISLAESLHRWNQRRRYVEKSKIGEALFTFYLLTFQYRPFACASYAAIIKSTLSYRIGTKPDNIEIYSRRVQFFFLLMDRNDVFVGYQRRRGWEGVEG